MLNYFDEYKQTIAIYTEGGVYNPANGQTTEESTLFSIVQGVFYRLTAGQRAIYSKIDPLVTAELLLDSGTNLTDNMYAIINEQYWYFVSPDDIIDSGEVVKIGLKRRSK